MKQISSVIFILLLLLTGIVVITACRKEYSYEGGPKKAAAVYTLVGAGGSCTGAVLAGKYYTAVPMAAGNTIQVKADVTVAGAYSLSTNTADGIRFSASGNFAGTGIQTLTLTGIGTPAATGDFVFTATAAGAGCSFTVSVIKQPVVEAGLTLDCSKVLPNGQYYGGVALDRSNYVGITLNVSNTGPYSISSDTLDGIWFSASGTFNKTGSNTILLTGHGTPDLPRNLNFSLKINGNTCNFTIVVTNPDPLAVYVIESGAGLCIAQIAGSYKAGTALSTSNTVKINVYVRDLGNFTIATAPINGMVFSYTGSFTVTGTQTVLLQGSGTPIASGPFSFDPEIVGPHPLGGQSCGFTLTVL